MDFNEKKTKYGCPKCGSSYSSKAKCFCGSKTKKFVMNRWREVNINSL